MNSTFCRESLITQLINDDPTVFLIVAEVCNAANNSVIITRSARF